VVFPIGVLWSSVHEPATETTLVVWRSLCVLGLHGEGVKAESASAITCSFWISLTVGVVVGCGRPWRRWIWLFLFKV
jgi:hypothetical protein